MKCRPREHRKHVPTRRFSLFLARFWCRLLRQKSTAKGAASSSHLWRAAISVPKRRDVRNGLLATTAPKLLRVPFVRDLMPRMVHVLPTRTLCWRSLFIVTPTRPHEVSSAHGGFPPPQQNVQPK